MRDRLAEDENQDESDASHRGAHSHSRAQQIAQVLRVIVEVTPRDQSVGVDPDEHGQDLGQNRGRRDEAEVRFTRGACSILTASSATYAELREGAKFDFGVAPLPYYDDVKGAPQNTLIGGGGLWVMSGHKKSEYQGVAKFLAYLSKPEVQAEWHQKTGYVPTTVAAYELTKTQGFYAKHPGHEIAIRQLLLRNPTSDTKGIRLGLFPQIRAIIDEELEKVWALEATPKQALDAAAERGNVLLRRFEAANKVGARAAAPAPAAKKATKPAETTPKQK